MPYVNIPDSKLIGTVARQIGKLEGEVVGKILEQANTLQNQINSEGCPANVARLSNKLKGFQSGLSSVDGRIDRFRKLPKKLRRPLGAFKKLVKLVLAIPIPQSVPPGFGIPVSITTKYADLLHLAKEYVKQISVDIEGLTLITSSSNVQLKSIQRIFKKLSNTVIICKLENQLNQKLEDEELTFEEMVELGLISDDGTLVTSSLSRRAVDLDSYGNLSINEISDKTGLTPDEVADQLRQGNNLDPEDNIENELRDILEKLQDRGIDFDLDDFDAESDFDVADDDKYLHRGPNGILYNLAIKLDPNSPSIAPRRFAVAIDPNGVEVLKGAKSFSSSVDILLDEIKFRIDNQLP